MFKLLTIIFVSTILSQGYTNTNFTKSQIININLAKEATEEILIGDKYEYKDILINPDGGICGYVRARNYSTKNYTTFLKIVSYDNVVSIEGRYGDSPMFDSMWYTACGQYIWKAERKEKKEKMKKLRKQLIEKEKLIKELADKDKLIAELADNELAEKVRLEKVRLQKALIEKAKLITDMIEKGNLGKELAEEERLKKELIKKEKLKKELEINRQTQFQSRRHNR